ncbi:exodeoxyribonuclease V subunit beta [Amphibiibacter pelophylacis]|uniref:Exodeoxyribonuclease V subunit beta n=1 Tax=Amphibiibacter pelophylacis TaxID=1799477 RepID=A0ACC6NZ35_9BURK
MNTPFDPLRDALSGPRLIEASAGTGKTYTLALRVVRLVLGHDPQAATPRRPLTPPEILVVTYTDAATRELRDRIRARLAQAARLWRGDDAAAPVGDPLRTLRDSLDAATWPGDARRLELAAEWMDQAAIFTIHGWCRRMLSEHAFDSGSLFSLELQADLAPLLAEAVRDYWRTFYVPLPREQAEEIARLWSTPDALEAAVAQLLKGPLQDADCNLPLPAELLARNKADQRAALEAMKQPWRENGWAQSLADWLNALIASKSKPLDGGAFRARKGWMTKLQAWVDDPAFESPWKADSTAWQRLTPEGMAEKTKNGDPLEHPALDAIQRLPEQIAALPKPRPSLLRHAVAWVRQREQQEQERRAWMGFDGLLTRLDAALRGEGGERLAQRIRTQFPVALVDEFQDTDPLQLRLFTRIYPISAENCGEEIREEGASLVLIGDPKQAIYGFRGADIDTYLQARRSPGLRIGTLDTNFRSSRAMVEAVNRVFGAASQRLGGALFRPKAQSAEEAADKAAGEADATSLSFEPVAARGLSERLVLGGATPPALTLWVDGPGPDEKAFTAAVQRQRIASACADHVLTLLQDEASGFVDESGTLRRIQPADCALLVNSKTEAAPLAQALTERGLRSVYVSDKSSVFDSEEADQMLTLLQACADPGNGRRVRAALALPPLGLSLAQLDELQRSDSVWSGRLDQFLGYHQLWQRQGVLPLLRHVLSDFGVPQRLLAAGDERGLTNWLHLAELLQQASSLLDGQHALVRHLAERRAGREAGGDDGPSADELRLRLPGEDGLIRIVTVHKSKGLEYPLVWLPFASAARPVNSKDPVVAWHDAHGNLKRLPFAEAPPEAREQADAERLGEDVRKLYVALTRARHATWMALAPHTHLPHSALARVMGLNNATTPPLLDQAQAWAQPLVDQAGGGAPLIAVQPLPLPPEEADLPLWQPPEVLRQPRDLPALRPPGGPLWRFVSYSSLRRVDEAGAADVGEASSRDSAVLERLADPGLVAVSPEQDDAEAPDDGSKLHDLPAGPQAGTLMHGLLEWAMGEGRAQLDRPGALADQVARRCAVRGWTPWIPALEQALQQWLATPLPWSPAAPGSAPLALRDLDTVQTEMEFWLPAHRVPLQRLDALVHQHTLRGHDLGGAPRPALQPGEVHGLFRGFIDLVARVDGRYVVLDYKSNRLGRCAADYDAPALARAMAAHRYDLQGVIYLYALHRLLAARLPDYDYDRHVGGVGCLFLRGIAGPVAGLHLERPPRALMMALDDLMGEATPGHALVPAAGDAL